MAHAESEWSCDQFIKTISQVLELLTYLLCPNYQYLGIVLGCIYTQMKFNKFLSFFCLF